MVFVVLVGACSAPRSAPLTDAQVIKKFTTHRQAFVRLVDAVTTDPRIASVDIEEDGSYRVSPGGVPKAKVDQVVAAARALGVRYVGVPPPSGDGRYVQFLVSAAGLSVAGTAKSLVYSEGPVEGNAVPDTDTRRPSGGILIVHRKIAENWYVQKVSN